MHPTDWNFAANLLRNTEAAPALIHGGNVVSHGELKRRVLSLAGFLSTQLPDRQERVAIVADNSPFFVEAYLGVMRAGHCAVPLPAGETPARLARLIRFAEASVVLAQSRPAAALAAQELPGVTIYDEGGLQRALHASVAHPQAEPAIRPDRPLAALMFTSGSTGQPRGVMVSHANLLANTRDIIAYLELTSQDRVLAGLPFSYCYGASLLHTHLYVGGSAVLVSSFTYQEKVLQELETWQCTGFAGVPSTYQMLLRRSRFSQSRFPSLRWLQQAGGRLPSTFIRELRSAHPLVRLYIMYGQTEATARLSYLPPDFLDSKMGSIGKGLPSTRLEVLKEDGQSVRPGSGEVGEIVASGPNVTLGYWKDPEGTAHRFRDGKLYTGDLAYVDEEGFIFIVDRTTNFIKPLGNRVSEREVEEVIASYPGIVDVAVVGYPDDVWGEAICAFVVPLSTGDICADAVRGHCSRHLPSYKVPARVEFVADLPRSAGQKVLKTHLRDMLGASAAR